MEREPVTHFKELAQASVGVGKLEICRADWQAGNSELIIVALSTDSQSNREVFSLLRRILPS